MFDKDKFKQELTAHDIEKVLEYYQADYYIGKDDNIISETVCHNKHGGSHKLYYYPESHSFHCYTGCGSFDIYEFIIRVNKTRNNVINFREAIKELGYIIGKNINFNEQIVGMKSKVKTIDDWDWLKKIQRKKNIEPELKIYDKKILNYFNDMYPSSWLNEGISIETMQKYDIKFYPEMFQTVIPHYNMNGELIGIRSRNWNKDYVKRAKYIPTYIGETGYNHPLGFALYGLYQNKDTIKKKKKVMIVEGEKSCLFSDTYYGNDNYVVAICGSSMNKYQANLLLNLGVEQVIIALDKEYFIQDSEDYLEYMRKVKKIGKLFAPYVTTYHLTDTRGLLGLKESPLDISKDELEDMMEHDKHLLTLKELESGD